MALKDVHRIVIKVGTRLLTYANGKINLEYMDMLVREIADLKNWGKDVLLVSSGAIGAGIGKLNLPRRPTTTAEKQAVAAIGQGLLIQYYEKMFAEYGHVVAQVLLTHSDITDRKRFLNVCNTFSTLLNLGAVPIVNENDTVSTEEIEFGDNDILSAMVAGVTDADILIVLTNIDGLYTDNPFSNPGAQKIELIEKITPYIKTVAQRKPLDDLSTGGMETKIQAAEVAMASGVDMVIADGMKPGNIKDIVRGVNPGTMFLAERDFLRGRKKWIAFGQKVKGEIFIDGGALKAISKEGKSLLPSGVVEVSGEFLRGDVVSVSNRKTRKAARGIVNYSSEELDKIKGTQSREIKEMLGYCAEEEVIHRDNMVLGF